MVDYRIENIRCLIERARALAGSGMYPESALLFALDALGTLTDVIAYPPPPPAPEPPTEAELREALAIARQLRVSMEPGSLTTHDAVHMQEVLDRAIAELLVRRGEEAARG